MESSLFFIDLSNIAGGLRSSHNGRLDVFSGIPFVNPFMIQSARVIIAYNLMVKKEEVCVYTESNAIRKGGMMKKNQRVTQSGLPFHPSTANQNIHIGNYLITKEERNKPSSSLKHTEKTK